MRLWVVAWGLVACVRSGEFLCDTGEQCLSAGVQGFCEGNHRCSFPDPACDSGRRFGELAGDVAGTCVDASAAHDGPEPPMGDAPPGLPDAASAVDAFECPGGCGCLEAVDCGQGHTCVVRSSGHVTCWGDDSWGQIGDGPGGGGAGAPVDVNGLSN